MNKKYVSHVQKRDGEYFIEIPIEICEEFGWKENDILEFEIKDNEVVITRAYVYSKEVDKNDKSNSGN